MSTNDSGRSRVTFETPEPSPLSAVTLPLGQLCSHVWPTLPLYVKGGMGPTLHVSLPPHPNIESPIVLDDAEGSSSLDLTGECIREAANGFSRVNAHTTPLQVGLLRSSVLQSTVGSQRANISAYLSTIEGDNSPRAMPVTDAADFLAKLDPHREKEKLWVHIDASLPVNEYPSAKDNLPCLEKGIPPALEEQLQTLIAKSVAGYNDQQLTLLAAATNVVSLSSTRASAAQAFERILFFVLQQLKSGTCGEGFLQRVVTPTLHLVPLVSASVKVLVDIAAHLREISANSPPPKGDHPASVQTTHFVERVKVDSTNGGRWESTIKFPYAKRLVVAVERCDEPKHFACGHVGSEGFTPLKLVANTQQSFPSGTLLVKHKNEGAGMGSPSPSRDDDSNGGSPVGREPSDWGSTLFDRAPSSGPPPPSAPQTQHHIIATIKAEIELEVDTDANSELRHAIIDALVFVGGSLLKKKQVASSSSVVFPLCRGGLGGCTASVGVLVLQAPDDVFSMQARCRRSEVPAKKPVLAVAAHSLFKDTMSLADLWRHPLWRELTNRAAVRPAIVPEGVIHPDFSPTQVAEGICRTVVPLAAHGQSIHTTAQVLEWSERILSSQTHLATVTTLIEQGVAAYDGCRTGLTLLHTALDMAEIPPAGLDRLIGALRDFLSPPDHYLSSVYGCGAEREDDIRQMMLEALRKLFTLNRMQRRQADTVASHRYLRTELRHGTAMLGMIGLLSTPLDQWDLAGLCKPYGRQKFTLIRELAEMLPKFGEFARSQSFSLNTPSEEFATQSVLEGLVNIWANPDSARAAPQNRRDGAQEKLDISFDSKLFHHYPTPFIQPHRVFGYTEVSVKSEGPMIVALLPPASVIAYTEGKSVGSFSDANQRKYHFYDISGKASSPNQSYTVPPLFAGDMLGIAFSIEGTSQVVHYYVNSLKVLTVPLVREEHDQLYVSVISQRQCKARATIRFSEPFRKNHPTELNPSSRHRPTQHLVSAFALTAMHVIMGRAAKYSIHDAKQCPTTLVSEALQGVLSLGEGLISESIEGICDAATALLNESPPEATERVKVNTAIKVYDRMLYSLLCIAKVVVAGSSLGRQGFAQPPLRLLRAIVHLLQQPVGLSSLLSCEAAAHILGASLRNGLLGSGETLDAKQYQAILQAVANSLNGERFTPQFNPAPTLVVSSHGLRVAGGEAPSAATTIERMRFYPDQPRQLTFSVLFQRRAPALAHRTLIGVCHASVLEENALSGQNYWGVIQSNPNSCFVLPVAARVEQQSLVPGLKSSAYIFSQAFQSTGAWLQENEMVFGPDDTVTVTVRCEGRSVFVGFYRNGVSLGDLYSFPITEPIELAPVIGFHDRETTAVLVSPLFVDRHEHRMVMFLRELSVAFPLEVCKLDPVLQRALLRGLGSDGDPARLSLQTVKERRQVVNIGFGGRIPPEAVLQHLVGVLGGRLEAASVVSAPSLKPCTLTQFNDSSATAMITVNKGHGRHQSVPISQLRCNVGTSLFVDVELSSLGVASLVKFISSRVFSDERGKVSIEEAGIVVRALRVLRGLLYIGQTIGTNNVASDRADANPFSSCSPNELRDFYEVLQLLGSVEFITHRQLWGPQEKESALLSANWKDMAGIVGFAWCVIDALPPVIHYNCSPHLPCFDDPRQAVRIPTASEMQRENLSLLQEMTTYQYSSEVNAEVEDAAPVIGCSRDKVCFQCGGSPWSRNESCRHPIPKTSFDMLCGLRERKGGKVLGVLEEVWKQASCELRFSTKSTFDAVFGVGQDAHGTFDFSGSFSEGWHLKLRTQYRHIDVATAEVSAAAEEEDQWACEVCTFLNDNTSTRCGICSSSRPGASWSCGECTYAYNSTSTARCEMCGTSRPGAQTADPTSEFTAVCPVCSTSVPYARFSQFVAARECATCGITTEYQPTIPVRGSIEGTMLVAGDTVACRWVADITSGSSEEVQLQRGQGVLSAQVTPEEAIEMELCVPPLPSAASLGPKIRQAYETSSMGQVLSFFAASIFPYVVGAFSGEQLVVSAETDEPTLPSARSVAAVVGTFTCTDPFWTHILAEVLVYPKDEVLRACLDVLAVSPSVVLSRLAASLVTAVPACVNETLYTLSALALSTTSELRRDSVVETLACIVDSTDVDLNLSILSKLLLARNCSSGIQRLMVLVATRGERVPFETAAPTCMALALMCEGAMSRNEPLPAVVDTPVASLTHRLVPMPNTTMVDDWGLSSGQVRGSSPVDPRKGGKYYYEVVVPPTGRNVIHMGWGTREHEQQSSFHHVGADNHSVAFDLQSILHVMGGGQEYHPPRQIRGGDVVGALLDVDINQMCWSLNGEEIGMWMMVPLPTVEPLFPFVSARVDDGKVEIKLGNTRFCPEGFSDFSIDVSEETFTRKSSEPPQSFHFYEQLCHWANDLCTLGIRLEDIKGGDNKWEARGRTQLALYSLVAEKVQDANGSLASLQPYLQHLDSLSALALSASSLEASVRSLEHCAASYSRVKRLLLFAARWGVVERVLVSAMDRDARAFPVTVDMALAKQPASNTLAVLQNSIFGQLYSATQDENIFRRRNMLTIKLNGSISEDGGGILRTVLSLLAEEMMFTFNSVTSEREPPKLPIFRCNDHSSLFNVIPNTECLHGPNAEQCQSMLRWLGKVMGNAALTGRIMLAVSFPKILWMKLVDDSPSIEDLFYDCNDTCKKSLEDPDLLLSDLYFDAFPFVDQVSLLQTKGDDEKVPSSPLTGPPGGMFVMPSSDDLTVVGHSRSKHQQKMLNRRREAATNSLLSELDEAIGFIKEGMESVIPTAALAEMHWDDLRRRVTGSSTQTPSDLLREMDMEGLSSSVRAMLTEAVESLPPDLCSRLLLFCTGQSRLPLPEKIKVVELDEPSKVPSSHTCSPITLTVHNYRDTEEMRSKLLTAISNAYEFGFV